MFYRGGGHGGGGGGNGNGDIDFPLRILVQSDMVGAIIGRGGQTIRSITQQSRCGIYKLAQIVDFIESIESPDRLRLSELASTSTERRISARPRKQSPFTASRRTAPTLVGKS